MRAVAYIRVSDVSQIEGYSLDAQERFFLDYCKARDWIPVQIYREEGRSARSESIRKRPVFKQLLEDSGSGHFDVAVVHTIDRWSRNQRVLLESLSTLAKNNVSLASVTENIDYSTPQGKLFLQMLGGFAEYFSDSLGNHVSKGLSQRAISGRHTGGLPFGYQSCWDNREGESKRRCDPEHPGGIHSIEEEANAIIEMFNRYATGSTTLAQLASWLNEIGFRTRNTKKLTDGEGNLVSGPKLFTTASVRGILHNNFYTGLVKHKGETYQGSHEALVTKETFELVEATLRKNSGRSNTLKARPDREYLLKGIARCAYCLMPMWSQTYKSGNRFYREHRNSRSIADCPSSGGSIKCDTVDEQIGKIMGAIELGPRWKEQVLAIISVKDEVDRVKIERKRVQEKLRRLGTAFVDGVYDEKDYKRQRRNLELELESLVVPQADAAEEAGKLIERLPELWEDANATERRKLLLTMLDGVYIDAKDEKRVVAIKPKPPFRPILQIATTKAGSEVVLVHEKEGEKNQPPPRGEEADDLACSWWRRGRPRIKQTLPTARQSCRAKRRRAARFTRSSGIADSARFARLRDPIWSNCTLIQYVKAGSSHIRITLGVVSPVARHVRDVEVAGSMSNNRAWIPGTFSPDPRFLPTPAEEAANYREMAETLAAAGVDLILLEMMRDIDRASLVTAAAVETGLPVWIGLSCSLLADGSAVAWDMHTEEPADRLDADHARSEIKPLAPLIEAMMSFKPQVMGIMHSTVDATGTGLEVLSQHWSGPVMAYPEASRGHAVEPAAFAAHCRCWVEGGVQIIGGCCGTTIEHIRAMVGALPDAVGARSA